MKCLTEYQIPNLNSLYNLSDAHARQSYSNGLVSIVDNLPLLFKDSESSNYEKLLDECISSFMNCCGQKKYSNYHYIASHTASQSMEVVANYLRQFNLNTLLIEPTFDNIPDILKRHNIKLYSITEEQVLVSSFPQNHIDSLFLTLPNNPTGFVISKEVFENIIKYCSDNKILFIVDACFRLFDDRMMFDWYEIIHKYDFKFIIIEDTGKIWPTQDLKISFIISDNSTIIPLSRISRDFLLNVSPFILKLMVEICKQSSQSNLSDFRNLIRENREYLRKKINESDFFSISNPCSMASVELLRINTAVNSNSLVDYLYEHGIGVLPGTPFFWNNRVQGEKFIRVALARDRNYFERGIDKVFKSISTYEA